MPLSDTATPAEIAAFLIQNQVDQTALQEYVALQERAGYTSAVRSVFVTTPGPIFSDADWAVIKTGLLSAPVCTDVIGLLTDAFAAAAADDQHGFATSGLMLLQLMHYNVVRPT